MGAETHRRGFSVRVFLPDGDPDGIKVIEKSNWTGAGLVIPRALYGAAKQRKDLDRTGLYILVGPSEASSLPQAYIGEGDPVRPRLDQHFKVKDFWTHAVIFTSKDQNLNKAHVQHLEARLVQLAKEAKRCNLENGNVPQIPSLSEADTSEVEGFLDDLMLCLPVLGYGFFEREEVLAGKEDVLVLKGKGISAKGFETPKGFIVRKDSLAVGKEVPSAPGYVLETRAELLRQGVLVVMGEALQFTQDYTFASPSTAAGILYGRSANGRTEWKTLDGKTLKSLQEASENNES